MGVRTFAVTIFTCQMHNPSHLLLPHVPPPSSQNYFHPSTRFNPGHASSHAPPSYHQFFPSISPFHASINHHTICFHSSAYVVCTSIHHPSKISHHIHQLTIGSINQSYREDASMHTKKSSMIWLILSG